MVEYMAGAASDPVEVDVDATGKSSEGNQFVFDPDAGSWRFNLSTKAYSAPGTYTARLMTGDGGEYAVNPGCTATFVVSD